MKYKENMKKFFKISIINLFIIMLLLFIGEVYCFSIEFNTLLKENVYNEKTLYKKIKTGINHYIRTLKSYNYEPYYAHTFREPDIRGKNNKNIILLGCSYTYGHGLNKNQTFQYKLSNLTNTNVFNYGIPSGGPRESLHLLRNKDFLDENLVINNTQINNVEYFIYTYISDHLTRLIYDLNYYAPHFKITKEGKLLLLDRKLFYCSFLYRQFKYLQAKTMPPKKMEDLFITYIKEINNEIKQNYKTTKNTPTELVILLYGYELDIDWERVSKIDGVRIINAKTISDIDFKDKQNQISESDLHPSEKAWNIIVPALVKELDL